MADQLKKRLMEFIDKFSFWVITGFIGSFILLWVLYYSLCTRIEVMSNQIENLKGNGETVAGMSIKINQMSEDIAVIKSILGRNGENVTVESNR